MSKQTAWAHLPNAHHIDRILVDVENRPQAWGAAGSAARYAALNAAWDAAWDAAWEAAWDAARDAAWEAAWDAARGAAWGAARGAAWETAWDAARDAILSLIAWDDAGAILDMPTDAVRLLAASGYHPAVLLLPAAIALSTTI